MKTLRCNYYVNPENTSWRGLRSPAEKRHLHGAARLTNLNDKKRNLMRKSHAILEENKENPIAKYQTNRTFWYPFRRRNNFQRFHVNSNRIFDLWTILKKTILKRTILKKTPISVPGKSHSISNVKKSH